MASGFSYPPPGGAPNTYGATPLRPSFGSPLDNPLQGYYQAASVTAPPVFLEEDWIIEQEQTSRASLQRLVSYFAMKTLSLGMTLPFENALTLLQVQYLPTNLPAEPVDDDADIRAEQEQRDEEFRRAQEEQDEEFIYNDGPGSGGYYSDNYYDRRGSSRFNSPPSSGSKLDPSASVFRGRKNTDQSGYLVRPNVYDDDMRPAFQLAPLEGGIWSTAWTLAKHPTEGYLSLWKGLFANLCYDVVHLVAQPGLENTLNGAFGLDEDSESFDYIDRPGAHLATLVTSHVVVGFILSPLELVRTRMVVQSSDPKQRKYANTFDCIMTIAQEEGIGALWGGVNLVPTLVYHTASALFSKGLPLLISCLISTSQEESPVVYACAELGLNLLDVLIRLPIDTIRKRLQIQIHAKIPGKRYETVVETRKQPYAGMVDCFHKIIAEEGGPNQRRPRSKHADQEKKPSKPWFGPYPFSRLYHGAFMNVTTNVGVFALGMVGGIQIEIDDPRL